jgi:hypothetical protein
VKNSHLGDLKDLELVSFVMVRRRVVTGLLEKIGKSFSSKSDGLVWEVMC